MAMKAMKSGKKKEFLLFSHSCIVSRVLCCLLLLVAWERGARARRARIMSKMLCCLLLFGVGDARLLRNKNMKVDNDS